MIDETKITPDLGEPAAYPYSSPTEIRSASTLQALLDPRFIKAEIRTLDKVPNTDGTFTITTEAQVPIGKFEIQLKTLRSGDANAPKYQCTKKFLAFCHSSTLAVILIVVDNDNNLAYWKYMDSESIADASSRINGDSITIPVPVDNRISRNNLAYVDDWIAIVKAVKNKLEQHDHVSKLNKELQAQMNELSDVLQKLQPVSFLKAKDIEEIHRFLDQLNFILDHEFNAVKLVRYPDYWKIGIGIFRYSATDISFFLYPMEFSRNETLIKEFRGNKDIDIDTIFLNLNAILFAAGTKFNYIRHEPISYAYKELKSTIERVVGHYNFPIEDEFLANEYLYAFIQKFHVYFGLDQQLPSYSTNELLDIIDKILPIEIEVNHNWNETLTEYEYNIDSDMDRRPSPMFVKRILDARQRIKQEYQPKIKISIRSEKWNIELIRFYLDYLTAKDIKEIKQVYTPMIGKPIVNLPLWAAWDEQAAIHNLKLFVQNFKRLYKSCLLKNFPLLEQPLDIFENYDLLIYVVRFSPDKKHRPLLEFYTMRGDAPVEKEILAFGPEDPGCPVDRYKMYNEKDWTCFYKGVKYEAVVLENMPIEFLFEPSPSYALINIMLARKVKDYLKEQTMVVR